MDVRFKTMSKIKRTYYFDQMVNSLGDLKVKLLTGVKGCGKTELVKDFIEYLSVNSETTNIIYVNFDKTDFDNLKKKNSLLRYISSSYAEDKMNFVFIDEVQKCSDYVDVILNLYDNGEYNLYLTASADILQNPEVAEKIGAFTKQIMIYPFSYREYLEYYGIDGSTPRLYSALDGYIRNGGLPETYNYTSISQRYNLVEKEIYGQSVMKELQGVHVIKNRAILFGTVNYLYNNLGKVTSGGEISNYLVSRNATSDNKTVSKYLGYLTASKLFEEVERFDLRKQVILAKENKYFVSDLMFRYAHLSSQEIDMQKALENLVVMQLLRNGYDVKCAQLYQKEFGFFVTGHNRKFYVAVSDSVAEEELTDAAENMLKIKDNYPKMVLARTSKEPMDHRGVEIIDAASWLYNN